MNSTLRQRLPVDWNRRSLTEFDFDLLCEAEGVHVLESQTMKPQGLYLVYDTIPVICVNRRLRGWQRLFVRFHELGHHWLHAPGNRHSLDFERKAEAQANLIAVCALIPFPLLSSTPLAEIAADNGYSVKLCRMRERAWRLWGM